ncbi:hypothetical protein [Flagellimonas allohymeniacidonis]|uniref:Arginine deiminase n=1 Tax=Flagellimonas allohymeniacidonis TaxID=2517819 RepID=A0A4Q8QL64_9FLAO|nr:hypothetical protein [Allomuricauda hymeniacidonis]TAI48986.1 hypothetical protein EW142_04100 [Allomuricauda hymeniacidonis]
MTIKEQHFFEDEKSKSRTYSDMTPPGFNTFRLLESSLGTPRPTKIKLIGSAHGRIKKVLLAIPDYATVIKANEPTDGSALKSLMESLGQSVKFIIFTHEKVRNVVNQWLSEFNHTDFEIVTAENDLNFLIWAEDAYVTGVSGENGKTYLLEPISFHRYGDAVIADYISKATELESFQTPAYFQGGNVLVGDDFYLIGLDYAVKTAFGGIIDTNANEYNFIDKARVVFKTYLDGYKDLIFPYHSLKPAPKKSYELVKIGEEYFLEIKGEGFGTYQPIFHIDMFISLLGRNTLNNKYKLMVGDPSLAIDLINDQHILPNSSYALIGQFNQVAEFLESEGFEIYRNPMPYVYIDKTGKNAYKKKNISENLPNDEAKKILDQMAILGLKQINVRKWYFATSNNNLTEITTEGNKVFLPTYGHGVWKELKVIDEENEKLWKKHDFEVKFLDDFHSLASKSGAAHCISKYIERD